MPTLGGEGVGGLLILKCFGAALPLCLGIVLRRYEVYHLWTRRASAGRVGSAPSATGCGAVCLALSVVFLGGSGLLAVVLSYNAREFLILSILFASSFTGVD